MATGFFERIQLNNQPQAHPQSIITVGPVRFSVLTPRLIRLEWSAQPGQFEDHGTFAFPNRYTATPPSFTVHNEAGWLILDTGKLVLRYDTTSHDPFGPDKLTIELGLNDGSVKWTPGLANPQNLRGTRRTLDECAGDAALQEGLLSRAGWSLFDDSRAFLFMEDGWVAARPDHHQQDWYFFGYGHDYKAALHEYTQFGGAVPLIPRFVLGAWWSRYWAYSDRDLQKIAGDFKAHDLPLDVLVLDMDWHTADSWTGYTWNRELFPDPDAFLKWLHGQGLRTTLNLHPAEGVQPFEDVYPEFARRMGLDPAQHQPIPFRITDRAYVQHYFELLHHTLEDQGVDFWWMDWQQGHATEIAGLDPLPWLNHLHFLDSTRRGLRAMLYSRWGGLGNHRYHIGFSGDTHSTWESLQFQPYFTATASNVCYGWWSHDIGGHIGPSEPELFARWVQFGALNPCLRLHSTKDPLAERRPWAFSNEVFQASRSAFHLRYSLIPYFYTLARLAADTSISLCRPMYYEQPEEEGAYAARYQYYLGDDMIAAPIVHPADPVTSLATTDVWLPTGQWFDYFTKESFSGPGWVRIVGDLQRIPLLVRAGAIVPQAPLETPSDRLPHDRLLVRVFPGPRGHFRLYEDDGVSEAYHRDEIEWTNFNSRLTDDQSGWRVQVKPVEGFCPALPTERSYELSFEGTHSPGSVTLNGQPTSDWRYDADSLTTLVNVPTRSKQAAVTVEVRAADGAALLAVGPQHNETLKQADVKRLLGAHCPAVKWEAMADAVLTSDVPGRADALARLGGPLVRFVEYGTPEEAERHLGCVIVGGPSEGQCNVEIVWQLRESSAAQTVTTSRQVGSAGEVFYSPFALQRPDQAQYWTAQVRVEWHGQTLTDFYRSKPVCAAISRWEVAVYNEQAGSVAPNEVVSDEGLNPALAWETYRPDLSSLKSVNDPFYVRLRELYTPRIVAGEKLASYAVATITSPDEREAILQFRSGGPIEFWLNGQAISPVAPADETAPQRVFHAHLLPRATAPIRLHAGVNRLVVATRPPQPKPFWWFSVVVVEPNGTVMTDLGY